MQDWRQRGHTQQHQNTPREARQDKMTANYFFFFFFSLWQEDCKVNGSLGNMMRCSLQIKGAMEIAQW